ncbi:MAG: hypothetical protein KGL39_59880, partial [Patescibacteria group bacterium]|nr:hypothetical protein [Patescibacteria group bacterium]
EVPNMTPAERVDRILNEAVGRDLHSWEKFEFLPSIRTRNMLSEKQEKALAAIEQRIFSGDEEGESRP